MASGTHVISTHVSPMKDRSLAAALLRVSERKGMQEDFQVEKVVYCGNAEPFKGWTNVIPTARYSTSNRPRDPVDLIRKRKTKPRVKQFEEKENLTDVYTELLGMTSRADGHYHAAATLQELYEEYKKRQNAGDRFKLRGMVDPITFRYIPIDERDDSCVSENGSGVRLPVLKMTHANKQAKLLSVLESFMKRSPDEKPSANEKYSILGRDAASFYDKYRWYYKDQSGNIPKKVKVKKRNKKGGKRKLGYGGYTSGSESEDSGSFIRRIERHSYPPSYVIQIKDDESNSIQEETITFERKVDYALSAPGAPGIDRWVARVMIKDHSSKADTDTITSSTMSQTTVKSTNSQVAKLKRMRPKQSRQSKKQSDFRHAKKKQQKTRRRMPSGFYEMYHASCLETTKVEMNFNINAAKREGAITGNSNSTESSAERQRGEKKTQAKTKLVPVHPRKNMVSGDKLEPKAQRVLPSTKNLRTLQESNEETAPLSMKTKRSPQSGESRSKGRQFNKQQALRKASKEEALVFASQQVFESSEARQIKTPSSSTFNPDKMLKQMKDTADFITKASALSKPSKSIQTSTRFLSHIEDARNSKLHIEPSHSHAMSRQLHHPKQHKNPAQDKIQQMIDDEKALVSQVIKRLNSDWRGESPEKLESVPESLEDALSTAIAKARIYDAQNGLSNGRQGPNAIMKRRVVPPLKDKSLPTTTVGSDESLFIPEKTTTTLANGRPRLPNFKPIVGGKKTESIKGHTFSKSIRSLSNDRNETFKSNKQQTGSRFVVDSDFMITKSQRSVPGIFEASISSMKPARRIANVNQAFDLKQRA